METAENLCLGLGCRGKGFFAKVSIKHFQTTFRVKYNRNSTDLRPVNTEHATTNYNDSEFSGFSIFKLSISS